MVEKLKSKEADDLFEAILKLDSVSECYSFFDDLCTIKELQSMTQRFAVAKLLRDNNVYTEIVDKTGASTATISRVKRSLENGADGYELVFKRLGV